MTSCAASFVTLTPDDRVSMVNVNTLFLCHAVLVTLLNYLQLLDDERFSSVEKIKTISSTYMAAAGLNPRDQVSSFASSALERMLDAGYRSTRRWTNTRVAC